MTDCSGPGAPPTAVPLPAVVRAEALKLRTTRTASSLLLALAAVVVVTVVVPVAVAPLGTGRFALVGAFAQSTLLSGAVIPAGLVALVLGVTAVAGEHRHRTWIPTLLATPRRGRVLAAKTIVHASLGLVLGVATSLVCLTVTVVGLRLRGVSFVLSTSDVVAAVGGAGGYVALLAVLGLGVGAAVANQVAALGGLLVPFFVAEPAAVTVAPAAARWLPGQTGSALAFPASPATNGASLLGAHVAAQPVGGLVCAGYCLLALAAGAAATRRREIP